LQIYPKIIYNNLVDDIKETIKKLVEEGKSQQLIEILKTLLPKEEIIIRMRFGIGIDRAYTLEEIGKWFSLTRERIRQIEAKSLRKLSHPKRATLLNSLLN